MATSMTVATCKLCFKFFSDPRMLPCLHSFCYDCLRDYFKKQKSKEYLCPTCHQSCEITSGGDVDGLPKHLHGSYEAEVAQYEAKVKEDSTIKCDRCISSSERMAVKFCCNCCKFLCSRCTEDHTQCLETHTHELVDVGKNNESKLKGIPHKVMNCSVHADEVLKFYCETCSELVCRDCVVLLHKEHEFDRIEKIFEGEKMSLKSTLSKINSSTSKLEQAMSSGKKVVQNVQKRQKTVEKEIEKHFQDLQAALTQRKKRLLSKASEIGLEKVTALQLQEEKMIEMYDEVLSTSSKIAEAIEIYTPREILSVKGTIDAKLKSLLKKLNEYPLEPCKCEEIFTYLDTPLLKNDIAKFGVITGGCYAGASTAAIYMSQAIKGKEKKITLTARDIQDKPHPHGGEIVSAKLVQLGNDDVSVTGKVVDNKDGTYEISITPQKTGEHQLKITIENEDIKMSPFIINVREPRNYSSLCRQLHKYGAFPQPWNVAFDDNGRIYIADYASSCIQVIPKHNLSSPQRRTAGGLFPQTSAATMTSRNFSQGSALTFGFSQGNAATLAGGLSLGSTDFPTCAPLQQAITVQQPTSLTIRGDTLYIAQGSNQIQKITSGKQLLTFGTSGSGNGQLSDPRGICIDPEGKVYVSEFSNNRISVFSADGKFDHHISGNLCNPWGIAFDPEGNLHVANNGKHSIAVFNQKGDFVGEYGTDIQCPAGIDIDPEGFIFVTVMRQQRRHHARKAGQLGQQQHQSSSLFVLDPQYNIVNSLNIGSFNCPGVKLDEHGHIHICDCYSRLVLVY